MNGIVDEKSRYIHLEANANRIRAHYDFPAKKSPIEEEKKQNWKWFSEDRRKLTDKEE